MFDGVNDASTVSGIMVLLLQVQGTHCPMLTVAANMICSGSENASDAAALTGIMVAGLREAGVALTYYVALGRWRLPSVRVMVSMMSSKLMMRLSASLSRARESRQPHGPALITRSAPIALMVSRTCCFKAATFSMMTDQPHLQQL